MYGSQFPPLKKKMVHLYYDMKSQKYDRYYNNCEIKSKIKTNFSGASCINIVIMLKLFLKY